MKMDQKARIKLKNPYGLSAAKVTFDPIDLLFSKFLMYLCIYIYVYVIISF